MQCLLISHDMALTMSKPANPQNGRHLKSLRQAAKLSQRELAALIGEVHTNVAYWETSGNLPRSNVLVPMAKALGVSVEELLGEARPKRVLAPGGRLRQLFEAASKLPRSQQEKVLAVLEPFVTAHANGH
jgi:transcriptional regulator with XRE-family HTH domain